MAENNPGRLAKKEATAEKLRNSHRTGLPTNRGGTGKKAIREGKDIATRTYRLCVTSGKHATLNTFE